MPSRSSATIPVYFFSQNFASLGAESQDADNPLESSLDAQFAKLDKVLPVSLCVGYVVRSSVAGPLQHPLLTCYGPYVIDKAPSSYAQECMSALSLQPLAGGPLITGKLPV
jgi:hypothetical protein